MLEALISFSILGIYSYCFRSLSKKTVSQNSSTKRVEDKAKKIVEDRLEENRVYSGLWTKLQEDPKLLSEYKNALQLKEKLGLIKKEDR